jgi:ATPase subunit of ABC transporter with duplicated ATPase domains
MILKLQRPHLLVLDEPTNHLDIMGIEQLEHSLIESGSTVIFVSHDRRFVERVASLVFELSSRGTCKDYR